MTPDNKSTARTLLDCLKTYVENVEDYEGKQMNEESQEEYDELIELYKYLKEIIHNAAMYTCNGVSIANVHTYSDMQKAARLDHELPDAVYGFLSKLLNDFASRLRDLCDDLD